MIFVFGSNLAGVHGAGAAKHAHQNLGAVMGIGEGMTGNCYALPTKDEYIKTRTLSDIDDSVSKFLQTARKLDHLLFEVTPIGCGLAGFKKKEIAALFHRESLPENIVFAKEWFEQ